MKIVRKILSVAVGAAGILYCVAKDRRGCKINDNAEKADDLSEQIVTLKTRVGELERKVNKIVNNDG